MKKAKSIIKYATILALSSLALLSFKLITPENQTEEPMVRIAKLKIHPKDLENYKTILKEEIEASIRLEPGVITLYAVADEKEPTQITIFETYTSVAAYQSHIKTPHFIKYKTGTEKMVSSLELVPCKPILLGAKNK